LAQQPSSINGSPRNSLRSNHSSKAATPPPANRNGIIIDSLNVSPKAKAKEHENNNSSKIVNKNSANVSKMQQEQMLQQIIDQQTTENQKQMMELLHANKGVEALGVLVQYLVYNVSMHLSLLLDHLSIFKRTKVSRNHDQREREIIPKMRIHFNTKQLMNIHA
jgi:hypothetical protein